MGEVADGTGGDLDELLEEQAAYYRARAPVYDDWWEGRDTNRRSDEMRAAWLAERARLDAAALPYDAIRFDGGHVVRRGVFPQLVEASGASGR
jgi:hypothetical protein